MEKNFSQQKPSKDMKRKMEDSRSPSPSGSEANLNKHRKKYEQIAEMTQAVNKRDQENLASIPSSHSKKSPRETEIPSFEEHRLPKDALTMSASELNQLDSQHYSEQPTASTSTQHDLQIPNEQVISAEVPYLPFDFLQEQQTDITKEGLDKSSTTAHEIQQDKSKEKESETNEPDTETEEQKNLKQVKTRTVFKRIIDELRPADPNNHEKTVEGGQWSSNTLKDFAVLLARGISFPKEAKDYVDNNEQMRWTENEADYVFRAASYYYRTENKNDEPNDEWKKAARERIKDYTESQDVTRARSMLESLKTRKKRERKERFGILDEGRSALDSIVSHGSTPKNEEWAVKASEGIEVLRFYLRPGDYHRPETHRSPVVNDTQAAYAIRDIYQSIKEVISNRKGIKDLRKFFNDVMELQQDQQITAESSTTS